MLGPAATLALPQSCPAPLAHRTAAVGQKPVKNLGSFPKMILRATVSNNSSLLCSRIPSQRRQGEVRSSPVFHARLSQRRQAVGGIRIRAGASSDEWCEEALGREHAEGSVQIDLQQPRRRLLVQFNCNVCSTTTQRLVNPDAYKRGTVYVQCAGCGSYHQLVDNLGLVQEYDFRKLEEPQDTSDSDS